MRARGKGSWLNGAIVVYMSSPHICCIMWLLFLFWLISHHPILLSGHECQLCVSRSIQQTRSRQRQADRSLSFPQTTFPLLPNPSEYKKERMVRCSNNQ